MRDGALREPRVACHGPVKRRGPVDFKLAEDRGRKPRAGQLVRMLDIPAERLFGVFDHAGPDGDAGELAKRFKQAARRLGCGPARNSCNGSWMRRRRRSSRIHGEFVSTEIPAGADGQVDRAAQRLGLIATAGEFATAFGVTPWREGEAKAALALEQWIGQRGGTEPAEARQAVEQVRRFIEAHGDYRFEPLDNSEARAVPNRAGWRKGEGLKGMAHSVQARFRRRSGNLRWGR